MYPRDDPRGRPAVDYDWTIVPDFSISSIASAPGDWAEWMREEISMWTQEGDPSRYDALLDRPVEEEVCLVEIDGKGYLWDGYHRTGSSVIRGVAGVPALVGRPRFTLDDDMRRMIASDADHIDTAPASLGM